MHKTFVEIVISHVGGTQAQLARKLGWTPQRIGNLCSPECRGFPFRELWHLKEALNLSDAEWLLIERRYFKQYSFRRDSFGHNINGGDSDVEDT